jgi:3-oxoacyl-[acyl-carrier-protein] synthase-1
MLQLQYKKIVKMNELRINAYSRITNKDVWLTGEKKEILKTGEKSLFLDDIYRSLCIQYLKYFKMDRLSKAGFLGSEMVIEAMKIDRTIPKKDFAIVSFNRSSSLEDDILYQQTIQDAQNFFPSPSIFVYTLPNIVNGEIAIRNKILGETSFYITEHFSAKQLYYAITDIFKTDNLSSLLCGWIDYYDEKCDVLMMYISRKEEGEILSVKRIEKIYLLVSD